MSEQADQSRDDPYAVYFCRSGRDENALREIFASLLGETPFEMHHVVDENGELKNRYYLIGDQAAFEKLVTEDRKLPDIEGPEIFFSHANFYYHPFGCSYEIVLRLPKEFNNHPSFGQNLKTFVDSYCERYGLQDGITISTKLDEDGNPKKMFFSFAKDVHKTVINKFYILLHGRRWDPELFGSLYILLRWKRSPRPKKRLVDEKVSETPASSDTSAEKHVVHCCIDEKLTSYRVNDASLRMFLEKLLEERVMYGRVGERMIPYQISNVVLQGFLDELVEKGQIEKITSGAKKPFKKAHLKNKFKKGKKTPKEE